MSKPDWVQSPHDEGFHGRQKGEPMKANPYPVGSAERQQWRSGWIDLDHHLTSRDEAWYATFGVEIKP